MEQFIKGYMTMKKVAFEQQKRFSDCVDVGQLPFDFYIPNLPLTGDKLLIEYDGEHHFNPIYGTKMVEEQIRRDEIKTNYARSIGVRLIRIPF